MAHSQQMKFVGSLKDKFPSHFTSSKVLEVGSLDINGTVRIFFENADYTGIDVGPGKGVDLVCHGQEYRGPDNIFDTIISCECFEHNPYWVETFNNMFRVCKSGGLIIMSCATTGREEHGTKNFKPFASPLTVNLGWNYYKNLTEADFRSVFDIDKMFETYEFSVNMFYKDLYFFGIKK